MDNVELGQRIASIRQQKNLTLKEVSKISNITPSMLSLLENGKANPSVETIRKLAQALDVPIFTFFTIEVREEDNVVRHNEHKKITFMPQNQVQYTMLSPNKSTQIEMAIMEVYPGEKSSEKAMCHIGEEVAWVLEGTVEILLDQKQYTLYPGDSILIPGGVNHLWMNKTSEMVKVVFSITPPSF